VTDISGSPGPVVAGPSRSRHGLRFPVVGGDRAPPNRACRARPAESRFGFTTVSRTPALTTASGKPGVTGVEKAASATASRSRHSARRRWPGRVFARGERARVVREGREGPAPPGRHAGDPARREPVRVTWVTGHGGVSRRRARAV